MPYVQEEARYVHVIYDTVAVYSQLIKEIVSFIL